MAIVQNGNPYVHSNYYNFLNNLDFNPFKSNNEVSNRAGTKVVEMQRQKKEREDKLIKIRDDLKREADNFLGNKTPRDIFSQLSNIDKELAKIAMEIIYSNEFSSIMTNSTRIYLDNRTDKFFDTVSKKLGKNAHKEIETGKSYATMQEAVEAIAKYVAAQTKSAISRQKTKVEKGILQIKDVKSKIELERTPLKDIFGETEIKLKRGITESSSKALQRHIKEAIIESGFSGTQKGNNGLVQQLQNYFKEKFTEEVKLNLPDVDIDGESEANKFLNNILKSFEKFKASRYVNTSNVSGDVAEIGMSEVFRFIFKGLTNNGIELEVVGGDSDTEVQNKMKGQISNQIENARKSIKAPTKQSDTDWILINGDKRVRVQVKNYRKAIEGYLRADEQNRSEMGAGAQIKLLRGESQPIKEFMEKITNSKNTMVGFDVEEFYYALANEIWFDKKGSLDTKKRKLSTISVLGNTKKNKLVNKGEQHIFNDALVSDLVTDIFLNYLGISLGSIDKETEIPTIDVKNSNIFYYVLGEGLIPTWTIVDELLKGIEDQNLDMLTNMRLIFDKPNPEGDKSSFYAAKQQAVEPDRLIYNGGYEDKRLVSKGVEKGEDIIEKSKIRGVNLRIDAKALFSSSYWFDISELL